AAVLAAPRLPQGSDAVARTVVTQPTPDGIDNLALAQLVPAGWAIHNERMEGRDATGERDASDVPRRAWWLETAASNVEHVDIRDDRIYRFFSLKPKERLRSEEHTSELQSRENLVCRLLLEQKNYIFL